jgi:hypothetical protein
MKKHIALIASAGLNVLLAAALLIYAFAPNSASPGPEQAVHLAGLSAVESRQLVEALYVQRQTTPVAYEYWRSPSARDAGEKIALLERNVRVRAELLREFGPAAQDDPAFARSFRPYDRELPALSSAEQVRLQELNLERLKAAVSGVPVLTPISHQASSADAFAQSLEPDARLEYQLRESVLAKALSSTPFDFTEKEFRAVFEILATARPEIIAAATTASLNEVLSSEAAGKSLTEALGAERYEALRRSRDPSFNMLRRIADVRGISREKMDQAYAVLAATKLPEGDPMSARPPKELGALLGAEAPNVYRAFVYSRQAPVRGGPASQVAASVPGRALRVSPPVAYGN